MHPYDFKITLNETSASNFRLKPSFHALLLSAANGCEICQLLVNQFEEHGWNEKIQAAVAEKKPTQIDISLRCFNRDQSICTHGTLFITCGKTMQNDAFWPYYSIMSSEQIGFMLRAVRKRGEHVGKGLLRTRTNRGGRTGARKEMADWRLGSVEVDPDLGSDINFNIATQWLSDCHKKHKKCSQPSGTFIPTRLIHLGLDNLFQAPRLVTLPHEAKQYAALSHCWGGGGGGDIEFKTTKENLERMERGMSVLDMPANFQDAIKITCRLGIGYLWIDSLCIIQDSVTDWENEASGMGSVYAYATLTIAAAVAEDSTTGLLKKSDIAEPLFRINFDSSSAPDDALLVFPKC